jgi:hypothetical protein
MDIRQHLEIQKRRITAAQALARLFFIFGSATAAPRTPEEENARLFIEAFSFRDKSM